jgi:hypothetical protein
MYRIWALIRVLAFVAITMSPLDDVRQSVGFILLVIVTILLESFSEPRTTHFMSYFDRLEELVICFVICIGLLASGEVVRVRLSSEFRLESVLAALRLLIPHMQIASTKAAARAMQSASSSSWRYTACR